MGYISFALQKDNQYKPLQKLGKIYGPVVGFFLGPKLRIISVSGAKAVKEALQNDDFIDRPDNWVILDRTFGKNLGKNFKFNKQSTAQVNQVLRIGILQFLSN